MNEDHKERGREEGCGGEEVKWGEGGSEKISHFFVDL